MRPTTAVFDVGDVVLQWRPRAAFAGLLDDDAIDRFFAEINFRDWNRRQDGGRGWDEAEAQLARDHPGYAHLAGVFRANYDRVIDREVPGTAAILRELAASGTRLLSITNFSAELFPGTMQRFGILSLFEGIVVSGVERVLKPDPSIYRILFSRYDVDPSDCVFIDDTSVNVAAARELGMNAIQFVGAEPLREELSAAGLLPRRRVAGEPVPSDQTTM